VPETSCELFNSNLDRGSLFGVHGQIGLGFKDWAALNPIAVAGVEKPGVSDVPLNDNIPLSIRQSPWLTVFSESGPELQELIPELVEVDVELGDWGADIGPENQWQVDLSWATSRVAVLVERDDERDDWLAEQGWTTYHTNDFAPADLADKLADKVY
jgi:hypothetical protein